MTGMEMMLAKMLGLTPEKMQEVFSGTMKLIIELNQRMTNIENKINEIYSKTCPSESEVTLLVDHKDAA